MAGRNSGHGGVNHYGVHVLGGLPMTPTEDPIVAWAVMGVIGVAIMLLCLVGAWLTDMYRGWEERD